MAETGGKHGVFCAIHFPYGKGDHANNSEYERGEDVS